MGPAFPSTRAEGQPNAALAKAWKPTWPSHVKSQGVLQCSPFPSPRGKKQQDPAEAHLPLATRQKHMPQQAPLPHPGHSAAPEASSSPKPEAEPGVASGPRSAAPAPRSQRAPTLLPGQGRRTHGPALCAGFECVVYSLFLMTINKCFHYGKESEHSTFS